jgi:DNA polymerase V
VANDRGGNRENAGRKQKWGEPLVKIGVPGSMRNGLLDALEDLWEKGYRGEELNQALRSAEFRKVKKYDNAVSAGAHSTSSVGGDSMNETCEEIDLCEVLIGNSKETFIVPVTGDSMIDIGIYPGDWLIVDSHNKDPKEGDIVIVALDDEVMVKRFHREKDQIVLLSENVNHPPIIRTEGSIIINGIVKNSIRRNLSKTH